MLPHYLAIGVPKFDFFHSTPKELKAYDKAFELRQKIEDDKMWGFWGNYGISALIFAIDHCFNGRKAKSKFFEQPIMRELDMEQTNKHGNKEEVAVFEMKQRIKLLERQGLPQSPK